MKYLAVAMTAARQALSTPGVLLARSLFFLVILLHFSVVHSALAEQVKELGQRLAMREEEERAAAPPGEE